MSVGWRRQGGALSPWILKFGTLLLVFSRKPTCMFSSAHKVFLQKIASAALHSKSGAPTAKAITNALPAVAWNPQSYLGTFAL